MLHALVTLSLFGLAHFELAPALVDAQGFLHVASDSRSNHQQALTLAEHLVAGDVQAWWSVSSRFHTRCFSFFYAALTPLWGAGVQTCWLLNALLLTCMWVAWGRCCRSLNFNLPTQRPWFFVLPVWLLHCTQLLRDPFYMVFFLLWISAWVDLIQSSCERSSSGSSLSHRFWKHGIEIVFYGFLLFASRERFWVVAQVMTLSWMVIVLTLALQKKLTWVSVALLMLCCLGHHFGSLLRAVDRHWELGWSSQSTSLVDEPAEKKAFVFLYKIARLRQDFIKSYDQASNLDVQVQFNSDADVLRYMPRALMVATFSPFPSMWFKVGGKGGALGRRVAGLEMIGMTFVIIMAITGSIRRKWPWTELCVWCAILVQLMALGLVVTNGGALYRMRFVCWFLLILLAFGRQTSPKKA